MNKSTQRAKNLRKSQTDAEKLLWQKLRNRQLAEAKFKRQYVFGRYIVDFVCLEQNLIVEVDGGQHSEQKDYDQKRGAYLNKQGFRVVRFWNNEVMNETETVLEVIRNALINNRSPQPSPFIPDFVGAAERGLGRCYGLHMLLIGHIPSPPSGERARVRG